MKRTILLYLIALSVTHIVKSQTWIDELDSVMTVIQEDELFHGQVLIAEKGKPLFHTAYGKSPKGDLITLNTPLAVASITKSFTAVAVSILKDKGLLSLDDLLTQYFPKLPYEGVTIRHLLNMTSGLPRFLPQLISHGDTTRQLTNQDVIELIANYQPRPISTPGTAFFYNNDNYLLLASVIEIASGNPYPEFMKKNIFEPLGMWSSHVKEPKKLDSDQVNTSNFLATYGEGEIFSTAQDLFLFDQVLYTDLLFPNALVREMNEPTTLPDGSESNYGFGWRISNHKNKTEVYSIGEDQNVRASLQRFIDDRGTLIYIHNFSGHNWQSVYGMIRNIWEGKEYEIPKNRIIHKIDPILLQKYVGQYLTENFGLLHITLENDRLYLRPDPIPDREELIPSSDTTFYFANQGVEWEFFLNTQDEIIGFGIKGKPDLMGRKQ